MYYLQNNISIAVSRFDSSNNFRVWAAMIRKCVPSEMVVYDYMNNDGRCMRECMWPIHPATVGGDVKDRVASMPINMIDSSLDAAFQLPSSSAIRLSTQICAT